MKNILWLITVLLVGCDTKDISKSDVASAEKLAGPHSVSFGKRFVIVHSESEGRTVPVSTRSRFT